jgi:hypothetical protein
MVLVIRKEASCVLMFLLQTGKSLGDDIDVTCHSEGSFLRADVFAASRKIPPGGLMKLYVIQKKTYK